MTKLSLPPDPKDLLSLSAGEELSLSGEALTMRDAALRRIRTLVDAGGELPFDVGGQLIFYAGPCPPGAGRPCAAIGPTTSGRMDHFLEMLFQLGVRATLGKGPRSEEARALHERYGTVYLAAVGGIGALLAGNVESLEPVAWEELGPEAVNRVKLKEFPAVVAIDSTGRDFMSEQYALYSRGEQ